jgi:hypothetical protein
MLHQKTGKKKTKPKQNKTKTASIPDIIVFS